MPVNEFEKQVQQKMEELKLTPSEKVWQEVEYRIRKEKKRKRILFWFVFLFLFVGGGLTTGIWLTNKNHILQSANEANNIQLVPPPSQEQATEKKQSLKNNFEKTTTGKNKTKGININETRNSEVKKYPVPQERSFEKNKWVKSRGTELTPLVITKENEKTNIIKNKTGHDQNTEPVVKSNTTLSQPINPQKDVIVSNEIAGIEKNDKQEIPKQSIGPINDSTAIAKAEEKTPVHQIKKTKKWYWGIMLQKGRSRVADGFKFFNTDKVYADAFTTQSSPGSSLVYRVSEIRPSGSFIAGLYAQRTVSRRVDINFSLGYSYLSTKMNIGNRVDSSFRVSNSSSGFFVNNFYSALNSTSSYTNRYHFISFGTELSWKIINSKKISLYWENGFSYDHLLSSNALYYDRNLPGYYKDFGLLTHNHFFLTTGFSVPVFKRLMINPFAEYSLTPVLRNTDSLRTHFTNYGIRIKFSLSNKK
jgi:hypothetical protein